MTQFTYTPNEELESAWYERGPEPSGGLKVADTLNEVKTFAYECFDKLDKDGNGFISHDELMIALDEDLWDWRERSYICFLLRRLKDIADSFDELSDCKDAENGISRIDIQEYFTGIRVRLSK